MIEDIENEVDPMFDPVLEKQIIVKGRTKLIRISDTEMDYSDKFMLYLTTSLSNPHFSTELAAKTAIINFTVIQSGLEHQLLGRVLSKEQNYLEEQLTLLLEMLRRTQRPSRSLISSCSKDLQTLKDLCLSTQN